MIFTSGVFLVFFVAVILFLLVIRNRIARHYVLLVASSVFYGWWDWRFLGLMWFVILVSYCGGLAVYSSRKWRRILCYSTVGLELLLLGVFKYTYFVIDSLHGFAELFGYRVDVPSLTIILPVGISFYVFQAVSYVVDVYRGDVSVENNPMRLGLYISFFPQLVAGPIVAASDFLPQLHEDRKVTIGSISVGFREVLIGFLYKSVLADRMSDFADVVYRDLASYDDYSVFLASVAFHSQIYFDFAGYSLMAIGLARMMGYSFNSNFDYPYSSFSVTEFWRRWHISLSTWLRKYLYFSLGGNRKGRVRTYLNLMVTMLLGGLWHGASWNFLIWGGLHGLALVVHKMWVRVMGNLSGGATVILRVVFGWIVTQVFVWICWIPFRADSFGDMRTVFSAILGLRESPGVSRLGISVWVLLIPIVVDTIVGRLAGRLGSNCQPRVSDRIKLVATGLVLGLVFAVALTLIRLDVKPFVYFQF